ncbi:ABC transporter ATP-binding protein [Hamadaea sp. NPDC051192]|uniref:ABC transporter ATP-binding protein n=1 Tax=Hamadaea sp. NPDC051192 TaxID=3154940 RepID=UPI003427ED6C
MTPEPVLAAVAVTKHFTVHDSLGRRRVVRAVEDASLALRPGQAIALVGESGSGKTTLARLLAGYYPPTDGQIQLRGTPVRGTSKAYYHDVQLVFQDPFSSLNRLKRVGYILGRALKLHGHARTQADVTAAVHALLERVNLTPAAEFAAKFPDELSGGQRQRIVIARALAVEPSVLLGDEPVSMLDVSIRLDLLNLLADLRDSGLALLYITHDIASARYLADQITVMYAGQMVESGPAADLVDTPLHPYTQLLLASTPDPDAATGRQQLFDAEQQLGEPPSLIDPPSGCRFHPRCPVARPICRDQEPPQVTQGARWARCWLLTETAEQTPKDRSH